MPDTATNAHPLLRATIRVPEDVVCREFPSETVVLNLGTGKYHGLNPTAGEIFTSLGETGSVEATAERIAEKHEVELATVRDDVLALCEQLDERGLIAIEPAKPA